MTNTIEAQTIEDRVAELERKAARDEEQRIERFIAEFDRRNRALAEWIRRSHGIEPLSVMEAVSNPAAAHHQPQPAKAGVVEEEKGAAAGVSAHRVSSESDASDRKASKEGDDRNNAGSTPAPGSTTTPAKVPTPTRAELTETLRSAWFTHMKYEAEADAALSAFAPLIAERDALSADLETVQCENDTLEADLKQARARVAELVAKEKGRMVQWNCVHCETHGEWGSDQTLTWMQQAAHDRVCPSHPMRALEARLAEAEAKLVGSSECKNCLHVEVCMVGVSSCPVCGKNDWKPRARAAAPQATGISEAMRKAINYICSEHRHEPHNYPSAFEAEREIAALSTGAFVLVEKGELESLRNDAANTEAARKQADECEARAIRAEVALQARSAPPAMDPMPVAQAICAAMHPKPDEMGCIGALKIAEIIRKHATPAAVRRVTAADVFAAHVPATYLRPDKQQSKAIAFVINARISGDAQKAGGA